MGVLPGFLLKRLTAPEFDVAGVVVDANGTDFKEGDEVFGWIPICKSLLSSFIRAHGFHPRVQSRTLAQVRARSRNTRASSPRTSSYDLRTSLRLRRQASPSRVWQRTKPSSNSRNFRRASPYSSTAGAPPSGRSPSRSRRQRARASPRAHPRRTSNTYAV